MSNREVTKTTKHQRDVITLFVSVGKEQVLTRTYSSPWRLPHESTEDPNALGRRVEQQFHELCRDWGVSEATALTVYQVERRTRRDVTETDIETEEIIRSTHEHQEATA